MTICSKMLDSVEKKLEAGETGEQISKELCDAVKHPDRKLKYTMKLLAKERGVEYKDLVKKYPNTGLQPQKARKTKPSDEKLSHKEETPEGVIEETPEGEVPITPEYDPFASKPEIEVDDETPEEEVEQETQEIKLKLSVQAHLEYIMQNCSTKSGKSIETYNGAIRYALKKAGLWDVEITPK